MSTNNSSTGIFSCSASSTNALSILACHLWAASKESCGVYTTSSGARLWNRSRCPGYWWQHAGLSATPGCCERV